MKPSSASWGVLTSSSQMQESGGSCLHTSGDISTTERSKFPSISGLKQHEICRCVMRGALKACVVTGFRYL